MIGTERPGEVERIAQAIADGTPVDWKGEMAAKPELSAALLPLAQLEKLREAHGGVPAPDDEVDTRSDRGRKGSSARDQASTPAVSSRPAISPQTPFLWGPLRVLGLVGEGSWGEVYRAIDSKLNAEVALKLFKREAPKSRAAMARLLEEGRRLARVRHPNVLIVHGADEHDGRLGIWTEFVRGKSLEEYLGQSGPLSAKEATLIGLDLCRALAAVHAAKLVHCDVKTRNVMREEGGRIVLTDFGSMGETGPTGTPGGGTPLTMAPEQLRGEPPTPAADLYGLGVLLYRLVSARYPIEASTRAELERAHLRRQRVSLRDRRADLPLDFVAVVERAIEPDQKQRYASAGEMERALAALLDSPSITAPPPPATPVWAFVAAAAVLPIAVLAFLWANGSLQGRASRQAVAPPTASTATPAPAPLAASVTLLRRTASKLEPLPTVGGRTAPGDELAMDVRGSEPMHVYVLNADLKGRVYLLFPIPGASPTNPLAAGVPYQLPGQRGGHNLYWVVTSPGEREAIATIASRKPLEPLEQVIAKIPTAAPDAPVQYRELDPDVLEGLRGIGGVRAEEKVSQDTKNQLDAAIRSLADRAKATGDVWVWNIELKNPAPSP